MNATAFKQDDASVGLGESTALINYASAGLAPVRSDKWRLQATSSEKPTSIFPGIAEGDSGKNKNVREGLGSCHLYPRPGQARRKILIIEHGFTRQCKLYVLLVPVGNTRQFRR